MRKRAEIAALRAYPKEDEKVWHSAFGIFKFDKNAEARKAYQDGYEQAEKDIWAAIEKYLSKLDTGDFATVGWILKHLDEYKKAILEEG